MKKNKNVSLGIFEFLINKLIVYRFVFIAN